MKFDTIIIGGGLSGLVCGIKLQKAGRKCAVISAGQSALHFSSGTFDILDRDQNGSTVSSPLTAMKALGESHPYSKIGGDKAASYAAGIKEFFSGCGIELGGDVSRNRYRVTPTGEFAPACLSLKDFVLWDSCCSVPASRVLIINIFGYLDFNTKFIAESFENKGADCRVISVKLEEMERLRQNPSEMRATNIARVLDKEEVYRRFISEVSKELKGEDMIVLPAVFGLRSADVVDRIRESFNVKVQFVATMPPSVPGIRTQMRLREEFERDGGTYLLGDTVNVAEMTQDRVMSIGTVNFGNIRLTADNYVLASGSFFSKGLIAVPDKIYEPVFGLDVYYEKSRSDWYSPKLFDRQNYISFGVKTDDRFHPSKNGVKFSNLYAIGSVLEGYNALSEGSGAGVAIISAMYVADLISEKESK